MVIVGVGAAGCPGSACTRHRDSHWAQSSSRVDARKWQPVGLFGAPRPLFTIVCVCVCIVGRRVMFWAPGSPASPAMVSPIWVPPSILPLAPGALRCREMERGWEEGALATSRAAS